MIPAITIRRRITGSPPWHVGVLVAAAVFVGASGPVDVRAGSPAPRQHGHHCQHCNGRCGPHCPVRPGLYGFYGTQWRQWPGQGFMSAQESPAATPVMPPRMAVPGPEEESMQPRADEALVPLPETPLPEPERPAEPEPRPEPVVPAAEPEPQATQTPPPPPPAPLPVPPSSTVPEDDNLFNTRYRPKSMGKLSIGLGAAKPQGGDRAIRAATHLTPADLKSVPRVPFDPAAEVRELRIRIK